MKGITQLILSYNSTGVYDSNRAILHWMLQNLDKLTNCSIYTIAEETFSSTATISRLVKKLGYPNYQYFQKDIADDYNQYEYHNRIISLDKIQEDEDAGLAMISVIGRFISQFEEWCTKENVDQLIDELYDSKKIVIYLFEEVTSKFFLQYDMFMHGKSCEAYSATSDILSHCKDVEEGTMVLIFAARRMSNFDSKKVCYTLKERGTRVCLVTDSRRYASKHEADYKYVLPGVGAGVDMLLMDIFLYFLTVKLRQKYDENI